MADTARLALPEIAASQAQKHVTHNEALARLDGWVQPVVINSTTATPPASPAEGDCYIVAATATGAWAGWEGSIALYSGAAWVRLVPQAGFAAHDLATGRTTRYSGSAWIDDADAGAEFATLGVNTTADATNRLAVASPASLFTSEGGGAGGSHQLKINKSTAPDTASLLFQTGFSGRAEMGTAGSDDFEIKVSSDGASFATAFRAASATGRATLPGGALVAPGTAAAPGLGFDGDADTGLFRPGADQIGLATGGALRLLLTGTGAQLTGLLTGTAVTQSQTDTTSGRLMKVGDFGLGSAGGPPYPTDLDDATLPSGVYRTTASTATGTWPAGVPAGSSAYLFVDRFNITECRQVMRRVYNDTFGWWERIRTSGAGWGAWRQIAPQTLVGTCLLNGGVIAGAIIETGANTNGRYTRFMDGTQICLRANSAAQATDTALTWAAAFIDANYALALSTTNNAARFMGVGTKTGATFIPRMWDSAGTRVAGNFDAVAIGRWYS